MGIKLNKSTKEEQIRGLEQNLIFTPKYVTVIIIMLNVTDKDVRSFTPYKNT